MEYPSPLDHTPDCMAQDEARPPRLCVSYVPDRNGTVVASVWEACSGCHATTWYAQDRLPWRSFHRSWKAAMAVWIATWEHRHDLGGRVT